MVQYFVKLTSTGIVFWDHEYNKYFVANEPVWRGDDLQWVHLASAPPGWWLLSQQQLQVPYFLLSFIGIHADPAFF
jgi:hypothetical protein